MEKIIVLAVGFYLIAINLISFAVYGIDKRRAKQGKWRVSEAMLLILALIGGAVGAMAGMQTFRHKTKKPKFYIGVPLIFVLHLILIFAGVWMLYSWKADQVALEQNKAETVNQSTVQKGEQDFKQEDTAENEAKQPENREDAGLTEAQRQVEIHLQNMSLEEKVAQLFVITPEALTNVGTVISAGEATQAALNQYPVGGLIYFDQNLQSSEQVKEMLAETKNYYEQRTNLELFTCVDEEGGTVARVGNSGRFDVPVIEDMSQVGATGNIDRAYEIGTTLGGYLSELGFNLNFAPDADVLTNPANTVIGVRSFGADATLVAQMVQRELQGLEAAGVYGVVKHFPGHGATEADTHEGYAYTDRTLEEMTGNELVPFVQAISDGTKFIMMGHFAAPQVTGDNTPCSLSYKMISEVLRGQLGYDGIVITDALNMGAIVDAYGAADSAVTAVQAGNDMLLMPADFGGAYQGILSAVQSGQITEDRLNESVRRILNVKLHVR